MLAFDVELFGVELPFVAELPFGLLSFLGDVWNVDAVDDLKESDEDEMENEIELDAEGSDGDLLDAANEFETKEFGDVADDLDVNELAGDNGSVRLLAT